MTGNENTESEFEQMVKNKKVDFIYFLIKVTIVFLVGFLLISIFLNKQKKENKISKVNWAKAIEFDNNENPDDFLSLIIKDSGEKISIKNEEIELLLQTIIGSKDFSEKDRYKVEKINLFSSNISETILFDSELGKIWVYDRKLKSFVKISIENIESEREKNKTDKLINILVERFGGISIDPSKID